jgi:transposase
MTARGAVCHRRQAARAKQVTERGHAEAEVAARLGVSAHRLYQWIKRYSLPPVIRKAADDQ